MSSANEGMRYYVTPPLIGRAHAEKHPCKVYPKKSARGSFAAVYCGLLWFSTDQRGGPDYSLKL